MSEFPSPTVRRNPSHQFDQLDVKRASQEQHTAQSMTIAKIAGVVVYPKYDLQQSLSIPPPPPPPPLSLPPAALSTKKTSIHGSSLLRHGRGRPKSADKNTNRKRKTPVTTAQRHGQTSTPRVIQKQKTSQFARNNPRCSKSTATSTNSTSVSSRSSSSSGTSHKTTNAGKIDVVPQNTERINHMALQMPKPDDCHLYWIVTAPVRMRALIQSIGEIVAEGMFIARPNKFFLQRRYDKTKSMVVYFEMPKEKLSSYGMYQCDRECELPLDVGEFAKCVRTINQSDVVGICVRKADYASAMPYLQMYVMHPDLGYCYEHKIRLLYKEFMELEPVQLDENVMRFDSRIQIQSAQFKRHLNDCSNAGTNIRIVDKVQPGGEIVTELQTTDNVSNLTEMTVRLFAEKHDSAAQQPIDEQSSSGKESSKQALDESNTEIKNHAPNPRKRALETASTTGTHQQPAKRSRSLSQSPKYSIPKLLLMAKAAALSNTVSIFRARKFPLVLRFPIGGLGYLEYMLAEVFSEEELLDEH